jgi:hypothetical protein
MLQQFGAQAPCKIVSEGCWVAVNVLKVAGGIGNDFTPSKIGTAAATAAALVARLKKRRRESFITILGNPRF